MNGLCLATVFLLIPPWLETFLNENVDLEIPKNTMKSHEQFIFDESIPSNSTMVGENVEILDYEIQKKCNEIT